MIPDLLLSLVGLFVAALVLLLPQAEIPFWDQAMGFADNLSGFVFALNGLLPMDDYVEFVRWMALTWIPGWATFLIVKWIWAHVPVLGSGGS